MQTGHPVQTIALTERCPLRNFLRIAQGENVLPVLGEIMRKPWVWDLDDSRQGVADAVAQTDAVLIRYPVFDDGSEYVGSTDTPWRIAARELPSVRGVVLRLMSAVGAYSLGRVLISRLRPGGSIAPHADAGVAYADQPHIARYVVVLQGQPGSLFVCGDETVCMLTGEVWTFAAPVLHSCVNNSTEDRLHLIVDLLVWGRE